MNCELATLIDGLGAKKKGSGWIARCPAHDDRNPSLSISAGRTRKIVFFCHAGCRQNKIIQALSALGLWGKK